ncbi:MAG: IS1595 family transposase [Marinifilaceae bacterium]|jgi:transposase-like protein|nr:IS1595 family transposase [Marinifilaceae bacterium]
MKTNAFNKYLEKVPNLNTLQFRLLMNKIDSRVKKKKISNILETSKSKLICPFCGSKDAIRWGKRNDLQRYKCKNCNKTFNSLTGTPLARLQRRGHWLKYAECLKEGLSLAESAIRTGIHINTAFRWRHRFLFNMKFIKAKKVGGIVEGGHIELKESFKGNSKNKGIKNPKKVFIIYNIDRNNNIYDITNKGFNTCILKKELKNILLNKSYLITDNNNNYEEFAQSCKIKHANLRFNSRSIYKSEMLDSYRNRFIKWIFDHFKGVSTKYLENYVSWFRSLNEFKSGISPLTLLYRAKSVEKYRHQPEKVKRFI